MRHNFSDEDEFDDEYSSDWFNCNDDDPQFIEIKEKEKTMKEAIVAEVQIVRGNVGNESGKLNVKGLNEHYQDSDRDNDVNIGEKGKRKKREKYPRYLGPSIQKSDLYVSMKFRYKNQLR